MKKHMGQEAVQRTVENLKHVDLEKYKVGRLCGLCLFESGS